MAQETLQVVTLLLTVASGIVTQIYGFKAINRNFDDKLSKFAEVVWTALSNKLDVSVYAAKAKELHDKNNALERSQAALEREVATLKEMLHVLARKE